MALLERPMKDRIARSVFWIVWSRGLAQAVSFLSTLMVARLLSPADYGLMALASIWTSTIALVAELGLTTAIVQFPDLEEGELNFFFWLTQGVAWLAYLALYASAPAAAAWVASPLLADVLRVAGLALPLATLRLVPESLLRKRLELDKLSQAEAAAIVATVPVVLGLAWTGAGVWALVAGTLVMALVGNIGAFWLARWSPGLRIGTKRGRGILRYSLATLGARISWSACHQVDTVVLGKVSGGVVLGLYSMAKTLAGMPVVKVSVVVNTLALPVMAGLQADGAAMRASFLRGLRLVGCLTVPLYVGMVLVAGDLVPVAFGAKWIPMVPMLQILCLYELIHCLDCLLHPVLFARYRPAFLFWWTGVLLLVMPFAFWAGATWMGGVGVALAWFAVDPLIMAWMAREGLKELAIDSRTLWGQLRPIAAAALMMAACVLVVRWAIPGSDFMDQLARLVLASGVGAVVYGAWIIWRGGPVAREIAELAGWLLRARPLRSESQPSWARASGS